MTKEELKNFLLSKTDILGAINALEDGEFLASLDVSQDIVEELWAELQASRS